MMVGQDNVHCMLNWISACVGKALIKGNYLLHQRQASVYSDQINVHFCFLEGSCLLRALPVGMGHCNMYWSCAVAWCS